jgi:hypothetical protein
MCNESVSLMNMANTYATTPDNHSNGGATNKPSISTHPSFSPLQNKRHVVDSMLHPTKGTFQKLVFNVGSHASQNYNIFEYLAHTPCAMSILEVLQNFPSQRRTFLSSIAVLDPEEYKMIMFNMEYFKLRLSHHLAF